MRRSVVAGNWKMNGTRESIERLLAEMLPEERMDQVIQAVEERLEGPYGVEMLAPAFTAMREDVGRVTQKFPGSAENGSVYNHAACFYIYALYQNGKSEKAFDLFQKMIPGPDQSDYVQRGRSDTHHSIST